MSVARLRAVIAGLVAGGFLVSGLSASSQNLAFATRLPPLLPPARPRPAQAPAPPTRRAHRRRRPPHHERQPGPFHVPSADIHTQPDRLHTSHRSTPARPTPHRRPPRRARARIPPRLPPQRPAQRPRCLPAQRPRRLPAQRPPRVNRFGRGSRPGPRRIRIAPPTRSSALGVRPASRRHPGSRHARAHPKRERQQHLRRRRKRGRALPGNHASPYPQPRPGRYQPGSRAQRQPGRAGGGHRHECTRTSALGLIALAVAFLLVITRLPRRRRKKDVAGLFPEGHACPHPQPGPGGYEPGSRAQRQPGRAGGGRLHQYVRNAGTGAHRPSGRLPAGDGPAVRAQADQQTTGG